MSRNIRRVHRNNVDSYVPSNVPVNCDIESEGYLIRRIPKSSKYRTTYISNPTLAQRVSCLEGEVADINVALAEHIDELNSHENRISKLEKNIKNNDSSNCDTQNSNVQNSDMQNSNVQNSDPGCTLINPYNIQNGICNSRGFVNYPYFYNYNRVYNIPPPCNPYIPPPCNPCDPCIPCIPPYPCDPCIPPYPCDPCDPCIPCVPPYPCDPCDPCIPCDPCDSCIPPCPYLPYDGCEPYIQQGTCGSYDSFPYYPDEHYRSYGPSSHYSGESYQGGPYNSGQFESREGRHPPNDCSMCNQNYKYSGKHQKKLQNSCTTESSDEYSSDSDSCSSEHKSYKKKTST